MSESAPTTPNPSTDAADHEPLVIAPTSEIRQHQRGNKITLTISDEIHSVSFLTGVSPAEIISDMLDAHVAKIRANAKALLGEVVL